jgi:two-component system, response regulator PdtaR
VEPSRSLPSGRCTMTVVRPDSAPVPMPSDWNGRPTSFEVRGSTGVPAPAAAAAPLRVLLASARRGEDQGMSELLARLGHLVVAQVGSAAEAAAHAAALGPDVVLLDVGLLGEGEGASAEDVAAGAPGAPILLFCGDPNVRLSDREVSASSAIAYLPAPVPPGYLDAALRLAVSRGRALEAARQEAAEARRQLEERKLIERAKGVLMRRTGATEPDAYSMMRRQSQDRSVPLVDVARDVLSSEPGRRTA